MGYIVNGKRVEYFHMSKAMNGDIIVEYEEKFNLINAHMGEIMKKVREKNLQCQVFKRLEYDIIIIQLYNIKDVHAILYALDIPHGCYDVNYEDEIVVIDTPIYKEILSQL